MNTPILHTERLILRPPIAADFDAWAAFHADPETMRFLGGVQTRSEAWRGMTGIVGAWVIRGYSMFSVIERATGRWIGGIGPNFPEGWPGREVGWGIAAAYAGKGYAFEASAAAIDYAFDVLGWDDVIHCITPDNARSIALAKRLGSRLIGPTVLPPPIAIDHIDNWGQSASEWRAGRAALR